MTKDIAIRPTFSPLDIAHARQWAIEQGYAVGTRGRMHAWVLTQWVAALRPVPAMPTTERVTYRKATVRVDGVERAPVAHEARTARAWALANGLSVPQRGRISTDIVQQWIDSGMPDMPHAREEIATVYYHKINAITHKPYAKEHIGIVYKDMMPISGRGRPAMHTYWHALGVQGIPVRIVTNAMIINVHKEDDGELVYSWVSKADSKAVVNTLKSNVSINA